MRDAPCRALRIEGATLKGRDHRQRAGVVDRHTNPACCRRGAAKNAAIEFAGIALGGFGVSVVVSASPPLRSDWRSAGPVGQIRLRYTLVGHEMADVGLTEKAGVCRIG